MKRTTLPVPPYEGDEPYLFFAFAEADRARAWRLMRPLLRRGCRIWYCLGRAGGAEELLRRQERASGAALTVLYLSDALCADRDAKGYVLVNQKYRRPILCLDPDDTDRRLSMNLREDVPHLALRQLRGDESRERAILHAEGFSQALLGEPIRWRSGLLGRLALVFCLLALLLGALSFFAAPLLATPPVPEDAVVLHDSVIEKAAREAVGGAGFTEETLAGIRVLRLEALPESWDELALLPALETIELPQRALLGEPTLPDGDYRLVLIGGGEA